MHRLPFRGFRDLTDVGAGLTFEIINLTAAQIALSGTTPPVLLPDPGPDKAHLVLAAAAVNVPGTIPFSSAIGTMGVVYAGSSTNLITAPLVIGQGATAIFSTGILTELQLNCAVAEHKAVVLHGGADDPSGAVATINPSPVVGGTGYAIGDQFLIGGGQDDAANAMGEVDDETGGVVTAWHLVDGALGQLAGVGLPTFKVTGSGDDALTVTVLTITPATGTVTVVVVYLTMDLP